MPSREDIWNEQELLAIHRKTLAAYLRQFAIFTEQYAPPYLFHGIDQARASILSIKTQLRAWSVVVEDHPDDLPRDIGPAQAGIPLGRSSFDQCINQLRDALVQRKSCQPLKSSQFEAHFLGIHETIFGINAVSLKKGDTLTRQAIIDTHSGYLSFLRDWRPTSFLKRALKKNGLLCFMFEHGCSAEDILFILKQKKDTNPILDGALTVSWVLDFAAKQLYTHDILVAAFPPTMALPAFVYPGKEYLEGFIQGC